jgi:hypothetical protein
VINIITRKSTDTQGAAQHLEFGTAATPIQLGPTGVETGTSLFLQGRVLL